MADSTVQAVLEQVLLVRSEEAPEQPDVATFVVCGRKFQILKQTVRSRGQTLLNDLLDDLEHKGKSEPIYVEGDVERFRYIMDWYRFGVIKIPFTISLEEMRRECAVFGLPDDVPIQRDSMGDFIMDLLQTKEQAAKESREEALRAGARAAAHALFCELMSDPQLMTTGMVQSQWDNYQEPACNWHRAMIKSALFAPHHLGGNYDISINRQVHIVFAETLNKLAEKHGFNVVVHQGIPVTVELTPRNAAAPEDSHVELGTSAIN